MSIRNWNPFSKRREVNCPDGTTIFVYRNSNDAFPVYIQDYERNLHGKVSSVHGDSIELAANHKSSVNHLLVKLDSTNNDLVFQFRFVYEVFQTDPCGKKEYLSSRVDQILKQHNRLKELSMLIQGYIELAANNTHDLNGIPEDLEDLRRRVRVPDWKEIDEAFAQIRHATRLD